MSDLVPQIDHVLVNVNADLDAAESRYRALGFALTERGHHSIGSSNHLAIFEEDYFELLGFEPQNAARAAGKWGETTGLSGLIFKTGDAARLAETLHEHSVATLTDKPQALSRPVYLPDGSAPIARFNTLHLDPATTPSGRIFFCEHLTPELVWREEWKTHPNGVTGIAGVAIASIDPVRSIGLIERIYGAQAISRIDGGLRLAAGAAFVDYLTNDAARARYGEDIELCPDGTDRKVAIALRTSSSEKAISALKAAAVDYRKNEGGEPIVRASSAFGVALAFVK